MTKSKKRLISLSLALCLSLLSLCACSEKEEDSKTAEKYSEPVFYAEDNNFGYYLYEDHAELREFFGAETLEVSLPSEINNTETGKKVPLTVIGKNAFNSNTGAQTLNIPDSVTEIRAGAFHNCIGIENVNFGKNLKRIDSSAFSGCMSLAEIKLPDSLESIGDFAFSGCSTAAKLNLANVTEIGEGAFAQCISIEEISGGDNVSIVEQNALSDTPWYASQSDEFVTLGKTLVKYNGSSEKIELDKDIEGISNVFTDNKNITKIDTPSVKFVCGNAFSGCTSLKSVTLSKDAEYIGSGAFAGTPYLDSLSADKDGFVKLGKVLVGYTGSQTSLRIPDDIKMISDAFTGNSAIIDISTGDTVERIGAGAFENCTALKTLIIGKNVKSIVSSALYGTNLTEFDAASNAYAAYWANDNGIKNIIHE